MVYISKYDKLKQQSEKVFAATDKKVGHREEIADELKRVSNIAHNAGSIVFELDREFSAATKLCGVDITFLFFAIALQCIRQYVLTPFEDRVNDQEAAKSTKGHNEEHSDRKHRYYNPTLEEIHNNPVPFDANLQAEKIKGVFKGTGKLGHRLTLGHDPILGWVFGTANIATSTLTTWGFDSYHIKTRQAKKRGEKFAAADFLTNHADTRKVLEYTKKKLIDDGLEGKLKIAESLRKEYIHLKSDVNTVHSLPFPVVSTISPDIANKMADYGIDTCNLIAVSKQAKYSILINFIIAMIHRMIYDESSNISLDMYKVKTRKILLYSNIVATTSNVIAIAITETYAAMKNNVELAKNGIKYLDVGGMAVTLYRLISDRNFIQKVKMEFMEKKMYDMIMGEEFNF